MSSISLFDVFFGTFHLYWRDSATVKWGRHAAESRVGTESEPEPEPPTCLHPVCGVWQKTSSNHQFHSNPRHCDIFWQTVKKPFFNFPPRFLGLPRLLVKCRLPTDSSVPLHLHMCVNVSSYSLCSPVKKGIRWRRVCLYARRVCGGGGGGRGYTAVR